jgi:hypothetical protein
MELWQKTLLMVIALGMACPLILATKDDYSTWSIYIMVAGISIPGAAWYWFWLKNGGE